MKQIICEKKLQALSKNQLEALQKQVTQVYTTKYKHHKQPRYGYSGYKAMSNEQASQFFEGFYPHEFQYLCLFLIQALAGLRINEACQLKLKDIDFEHKSVHIASEKQENSVYHTVYMHKRLETVLKAYTDAYKKTIEDHDGYLFWSKGFSKKPYMTADYARKIFREVCNRVGFTETYAERRSISPNVEHQNAGTLHRFSTHSLRYWYIRHVLTATGKIEIASLLARHKDIKTTMTYAMPGQDEVIKSSIQAFG